MPQPLMGFAWVPSRCWLPYFLKLGAELELLGSRHNMNPTEDQVDALWTQAR
jgi:hypothetical protein